MPAPKTKAVATIFTLHGIRIKNEIVESAISTERPMVGLDIDDITRTEDGFAITFVDGSTTEIPMTNVRNFNYARKAMQ